MGSSCGTRFWKEAATALTDQCASLIVGQLSHAKPYLFVLFIFRLPFLGNLASEQHATYKWLNQTLVFIQTLVFTFHLLSFVLISCPVSGSEPKEV